ncbi:jg11934 [Pararge aegeria aegeria]|uniref:Jg11934 protein n=1 Tax=Pararge aegeria aegeria TaxID=348720 RepID=A0A8S4SDH8_9NEOP|nr:jg11934 [Pararge aegeria aegeria]
MAIPKSCIALAKCSRRMPIYTTSKNECSDLGLERDHPLGGRTSYCYGRAYHHSFRTVAQRMRWIMDNVESVDKDDE